MRTYQQSANKDNDSTSLLINQLSAYFQNVQHVVFAFLFGSYASSRAMKESDIDIAVYFEGAYGVEQINKIWRDLEPLTRKNIDLVVLNKAAPLLAFAALRGKAIIIKDYARYLDYMLVATSEAMDFAQCLNDMWTMRQQFRAAGKPT